MWPHVSILLYFLGGLLLFCGVVPLVAIFGGMNDCDDDDEAEAMPLPRADRPRQIDALRTSARVVAVRGLRERNERVEHLADKLARRKADWCLCGTPNADLADGLSADRVIHPKDAA